jgi:O-antigen/teichoic acid export membrane protein
MSDDGQATGDMSLGREVSLGFVAKVIQAALGFAGAILFARILGPGGFGGFYIVLSAVQIADRPVRGWALGTKKRFAEAGADRRRLYGAQILVSGFAIILGSVAAFIASPLIIDLTGLRSAPLMFVVLFATTIVFLSAQQLLYGVGKISLTTWNDTLRSLLTFPTQLGLVLAGLGATGMAFGLAAASLASVPVALYYLRTWPAWPAWETLQSVASYARYSIPATAIGKAYDRFDVVLLTLLLTPTAVGNYEAALKLTVPALFIANVASTGLVVKSSNLDSRDLDVSSDISNTIAFSSLFAIPIFYGTLAIPSKLIVTPYGNQYGEAPELLAGLALYQLLRTQTKPLRSACDGVDRPDLNMKISAATLALNLVLGVALVVEIGALGAVLASVVAETFRYLLLTVVLRRTVPGIDYFPEALRRQVIAGLLMLGVTEILAAIVAIRSWLHLGTVIGVSGVAYFLALFALSPQFRLTVRSVLEPYVGRAP